MLLMMMLMMAMVICTDNDDEDACYVGFNDADHSDCRRCTTSVLHWFIIDQVFGGRRALLGPTTTTATMTMHLSPRLL